MNRAGRRLVLQQDACGRSMRRGLGPCGFKMCEGAIQEVAPGMRHHVPSTRRFRVALGRVIVVPSISFVTLTWQPKRELAGGQLLSQLQVLQAQGKGRDARIRQTEGKIQHVLRRESGSAYSRTADPALRCLGWSNHDSLNLDSRSRHHPAPRACRTRPPPE